MRYEEVHTTTGASYSVKEDLTVFKGRHPASTHCVGKLVGLLSSTSRINGRPNSYGELYIENRVEIKQIERDMTRSLRVIPYGSHLVVRRANSSALLVSSPVKCGRNLESGDVDLSRLIDKPITPSSLESALSS